MAPNRFKKIWQRLVPPVSQKVFRSGLRPFHHKLLPDPARYIRLLTVLQPVGPNEVLSCQVCEFQFDAAPSYNAISYTWGEPVKRTILLNGRSLEVNQNCHDALVQAHKFDKTAFLWIDSICINQNYTPEKTEQVKRMYDVYRNADKVLACVGESDEASQPLFTLENILLDKADSEGWQKVESLFGWELLQGPDGKRLLKSASDSLLALGDRAYWKRLWIVQELAARPSETYILCGADRTKLNRLEMIYGMTCNATRKNDTDLHKRLSYLAMEPVIRGIHEAMDGGIRFQSLFDFFAAQECADSRDRVYGLNALIDWKSSGLEPIIPDYSKLAWDLAKALIAGLRKDAIRGCQTVLRTLRMDATQLDMHARLEERLSPEVSLKQKTSPVDFLFPAVLAARLAEGPLGELVCGLQTHISDEETLSYATSDLLAPLDLTESPEYEWSKAEGRKPQKVFSVTTGQLVALVCGEARSGDVLVFVRYTWGMEQKCLVLRPELCNTMEVIGNGIKIDGRDSSYPGDREYYKHADMEDEELPESDIFRATMQLAATPEDIMIFYLGVMEDDYLKEYAGNMRDPQIELLHLMTKPVAVTESAARLIPRKRVEKDGVWGPPAS